MEYRSGRHPRLLHSVDRLSGAQDPDAKIDLRKEIPMFSRWHKVLIATLAGLVVALVVSLINGRNLVQSVLSGLILALIAGILVAVLSWAMDTAQAKGYRAWVGVLLIVLLNLVGVVVLLLLPSKKSVVQPLE